MIDVVIIEDDPMVSMITKKIIDSHKKFKVIKTFFSGEGAIEYILENKIQLIILDMYLPDIDGISFLKKLKTFETEQEFLTNTIFVTASNDINHIKEAFQLGIVDYLIKPFEFERLEEALARFLTKQTEVITKNNLTQEELDSLYHSKTNTIKPLPKGIGQKTLDKVFNALLIDISKEWSSKEVAKLVNSSSVTVKKYLDYLAETNKITSNISYGSVGRPEVKYKINGKINK